MFYKDCLQKGEELSMIYILFCRITSFYKKKCSLEKQSNSLQWAGMDETLPGRVCMFCLGQPVNS